MHHLVVLQENEKYLRLIYDLIAYPELNPPVILVPMFRSSGASECTQILQVNLKSS